MCKTQRPGTMHSGLNRIPPWLFQFQGSTESPFCGVRVAEKLASPSSMWLTAILPRKRSQQLSQVGSYTKSLGFAWLPDYGKRLTSLLPSMGTSHSYQLFWPLKFPVTNSGFSSSCQCLRSQFPALSSIAVKHKACFPFSWLEQENFWCNFCPQYPLIFQAAGCDSPGHTQINSRRWSGIKKVLYLG